MAKHKLVDTWYYDVKDLIVVDKKPRDPNDRLEAQAKGREFDEDEEDEPPQQRLITRKVAVEVRLDKTSIEEGGPPYALKEVEFIVSCDEPKFEYVGTDIEALRQAAWDYLSNEFKITWENYYLVTVGHANDYGGGYSTGLTFGYKDVERGTTWDKKDLLREWAYSGKRTIRPWPGRFTDKNGRAIACIPVTPDNTAALEEFAKRINKLREMIRDTLKPEVIVQTLQNLNSMALLPPVPEGEVQENDED